MPLEEGQFSDLSYRYIFIYMGSFWALDANFLRCQGLSPHLSAKHKPLIIVTDKNFHQEIAANLPKTIGTYEILDKIGEGGFATVYLARSGETEPVVALKVLSVPESYGRFQREIETIATLTHPNIIRIFDSGKDDQIVASQGQIFKVTGKPVAEPTGTFAKIWSRLTKKAPTVAPDEAGSTSENLPYSVPYFTMEYIAGGTLRNRLDKEGFLSTADALAIIKPVGEALTYAHQQGVIHRDVNPNNILLDTNQDSVRPILTDFGLVKPLAADNNYTMTLGLIGTFHYYAPEQWHKEVTTPVTDLYALAITFFEMVAGQRPFKGDIFALREKHLKEPLPLLSEMAARLGPFFDDVLGQATAKDPANRYANVADFIQALELAHKALSDCKAYQAIEQLIKDGDFAQALVQLDEVFIQSGNYEYREVSRLLWEVVYATQHGGALPPASAEADRLARQTKLLDEGLSLPQEMTRHPVEKWHQLNKYLVPLAIAIAMIVGGAIAPWLSDLLSLARVSIIALSLLISYLVFYIWVYYISPSRRR